jgi:hypothetical protein
MKLDLSSKVLIVLALFAVTACAVPGSYVNSRVNGVDKTYRYDEGGKKVLVYEVDRMGNLIVYDPNDKQAQQRMSGRKWAEKADAAAAARMEKIKQAPKRKANDPISVNLRPIDDSQIEMTEKQKKDMYDYFRKQFENDPVIRLTAAQRTDRKGVRRQAVSSLKDLAGQGADVDVVIKVTSRTVYGTMNGKLASAKEMVFQASVNGKWMQDKHQAEDAGTLFDIPKATHRLSEKVKKIIMNDIGPTIPANRSL